MDILLAFGIVLQGIAQEGKGRAILTPPTLLCTTGDVLLQPCPYSILFVCLNHDSLLREKKWPVLMFRVFWVCAGSFGGKPMKQFLSGVLSLSLSLSLSPHVRHIQTQNERLIRCPCL